MIAFFWLLAFGWGDSDRVAEQHLRDTGVIAEGDDVAVWFQVGPPIEGLEVVTIKTRTHTVGPDGAVEVGDWENPNNCFVRRTSPPEVWCGGEAFPGLVKSYRMGRDRDAVADVTWVWVYVLASGQACGWPADLLGANPRLSTRQLELAGAPEVKRPEDGGVVLTLPCVSGKSIERVTVTVGADDSVVVVRGPADAPPPEPEPAPSGSSG